MDIKKLLIIDGNALVHRAYHALPPLKTKDGRIVNAVYGFLLVLLKAIKDVKPTHIAATFDLKGPTFRHEQFKDYKAKRVKAPDELYQQLDSVKEVLRSLAVPIYEKTGFEADDAIGTIVYEAKKQQAVPKVEIIILTGDLDCLQLVDKQVFVYALRKGLKDTVLYNEQLVREKYLGLTPFQLLDFRGLKGDPSDNIPGIMGVGEKTAITLIKQFGSLEAIYQALEQNTSLAQKLKTGLKTKLVAGKEQAFLSRKLSVIHNEVPLDFQLSDCLWGRFDPLMVRQALMGFEFYSLIDKFLQPQSAEPVKGKKNSPPAQEGLPLDFFKQGKDEATTESSLIAEIEHLQEQGVLSAQVANLEKELFPIVRAMEKQGAKVDQAALKSLSKRLAIRIGQLESKIYEQAGLEFNINSPSQVSQALFERLKLSPLGLKKTPTGAFLSTRESELVKLKSAHPIVPLILKHRELFKLKSGFADALQNVISEKDGRIHPHFHQLGTETGRMSCSSPNLQNIPIKGEWGLAIRKCFVAEAGFVLLSADYSQVELRIAAWLSDDKKMQRFFSEGRDIHILTASQIFKIEPDEVSKAQRSFAKTLNYGIFYGMGHVALAERTGVKREQAKEFIQKYFETFTGISDYVAQAKAEAQKNNFAATFFGRKRFLPEINSADPRLRAAAERMAVNMGPQGTAADIMKMAMVGLKKENLLNEECRLIMQIHDELLLEIKKNRAKEYGLKIKQVMENIVKAQVFLAVEVSYGVNWGALKPP